MLCHGCPCSRCGGPTYGSATIVGTWVPENELFGFTEHHPLSRLILKQVTLTSGSWKPFFSRARELKPRPNILCEGILPSRDSEGCLIDRGLQVAAPSGLVSHRHY